MSSVMYLASDAPLTARPNPHERLVSVNEALQAGRTDIPDILLEDGFDRDRPNVLLLSDREVNVDVDRGIIEDGNFDDDFCFWLTEKWPDMRTEKKYCAIFEWVQYTRGRAEMVLQYIREQLEKSDEIEFWHIWMDDQPKHRCNVVEKKIGDLMAEDIAELEDKEVWGEPCEDWCYKITK